MHQDTCSKIPCSLSMNTGVAPKYSIGFTLAQKVNDCTKTKSPSPTLKYPMQYEWHLFQNLMLRRAQYRRTFEYQVQNR